MPASAPLPNNWSSCAQPEKRRMREIPKKHASLSRDGQSRRVRHIVRCLGLPICITPHCSKDNTPWESFRPVLCYFNVLGPVCQPPAPPNIGGLSGGGGVNVSVSGSSGCSSFLPGFFSAEAVDFFSFKVDDFFSTVFALSGCSMRDGAETGEEGFSRAGDLCDAGVCSVGW